MVGDDKDAIWPAPLCQFNISCTHEISYTCIGKRWENVFDLKFSLHTVLKHPATRIFNVTVKLLEYCRTTLSSHPSLSI